MSLGTAGGLYHFRDTILKGNPSQIFVLHADIACAFVSRGHGERRGRRADEIVTALGGDQGFP
jgi:mannose-1-phosphate guanylyltransferase